MKRKLPEEAGIFGVLAVVFLAFCVMSSSFRTWDNAKILLVNGAVVGFLALGQTFVLLTGGIDLSTGANIAMTGVIAAMLTQTGMPWILSAVLAVAVGTPLGIINGALIHYLKIPPFIVTFATQGVALANPLILTKATSKVVETPGFSWIGSGSSLALGGARAARRAPWWHGPTPQAREAGASSPGACSRSPWPPPSATPWRT